MQKYRMHWEIRTNETFTNLFVSLIGENYDVVAVLAKMRQ